MSDTNLMKYCCGCGLCSGFVHGKPNDEGFYRPDSIAGVKNFDFSCCYVSTMVITPGVSFWGPVQAAYYAWSADPATRYRASSGGVLTEISRYVLDRQLVDEVVHIKVDDRVPIATVVHHSSSPEDVMSGCGSRYAPSASLEGLFDNLESDKRYAVIAKPCDIRVLREYIRANCAYQSKFPYLISFFCGGTPSMSANASLLSAMGCGLEEVTSLDYRGMGWPGRTRCTSRDGSLSEMDYEQSWGTILGRDLQEVCRFCWEGTGEAADICCGDGWEIVDGLPSFGEAEGRNVVLARTVEGKTLLRAMSESRVISVEAIEDIGILPSIQPGQFMRKASMFSRVLAMRLLGRRTPGYDLRVLARYARLLGPARNLRMFAGTVRRVLRGDIS